MPNASTLSIVRRGQTFQVCCAATNPTKPDHWVATCPDTLALHALLVHCGVDAWAIRQADTDLGTGGLTVLYLPRTPAPLFTAPSARPGPAYG